jgi:hypothetical protein
MTFTCQSCHTDMQLKAHPEWSEVVFCQKCKKKNLLKEPPPGDLEVRQGKDSLGIIYRAPRRLVAWLAVVTGVLLAVTILLWSLPSNEWSDGATLLMSVASAVFMILVVMLFFTQAKLRFTYGGASEQKQTIEIHQATVFSTRELVLAESIDQVFCVSESRTRDNKSYYVYHVAALLKSGPTVVFMKDVSALPTAKYIEARIEAFLQIEDEPVEGEVKH